MIPSEKTEKCYIYTRVSTAIQVDGYSLDAQKDKLRKYAEYQDMTIVSEFSDEGFSGKNQMSGNQISVKTLDLNREFAEIAAQLNAIVDEHFERAGLTEM